VLLLQFDDGVHVPAVVYGGGQWLLLSDPSLLLLNLKVELLNTKRFLRQENMCTISKLKNANGPSIEIITLWGEGL
jgi:hypothetical protein